MATVPLQLTAIVPEPVTDNQSQANPANTTPVNPNQAQAAPAQQDTVTLTSQTAQNQLNGQGQQAQQPPTQTAAQQNNIQNADPAPGQLQQQPAQTTAQAPGQAAAPSTGQAVAQTAAQTAAQAVASSTNTDNTTQQQQLAQLDQVLQQLGLNPASISLSNQLAMLAYINDPGALEAFVQQLTGASSQTAQNTASTANPTTNNTGNNTPAVPAPGNNADPAQNAAAAAQLSQTAAQPAQAPTQTQLTTAANAANPQTNDNTPRANSAAPPNGGFVAQFQELQLAFGSGVGPGSGGNNTQNPGATVNVTI